MNKKLYLLILVVITFLTLPCGCNSRERNDNENNQEKSVEAPVPEKVRKATFFIENSESMFGFVSSNTEYVNVLTELAQKTDLIRGNTEFDFNFINGRHLHITPIGKSADDLTSRLNKNGFRCGNIKHSNLNAMFVEALTNAGHDSISILISDGIYDVGNHDDPLNALINEGKTLRTKFIQRLMNENLQTLFVQFSSNFEGDYFPGIGGKIPELNQQRPYYIWIFGNSELLTEYFSEEYLHGLDGYRNMARFFIASDFDVPYEVVAHNSLGQYMPDKREKHTIKNISLDNYTNEFQFSIAVDFDSIPYTGSYFLDSTNYNSSPNYEITELSLGTELSPLLFKALPFEPSHLITVKASGNPTGELQVNLKYAFPDWIEESTTENDLNAPVDTATTFGLKHLTQAIKEAYTDISEKEYTASFIVSIKN